MENVCLLGKGRLNCRYQFVFNGRGIVAIQHIPRFGWLFTSCLTQKNSNTKESGNA